MPYDPHLADRMRQALEGLPGVVEKKMMGGMCFMVNGNMLGGASGAKDWSNLFMFRVGKEQEAEALARPGAIPVTLGPRRMGGMVFVDADTVDEDALQGWISFALNFVGNLPHKG